MNSKALSYEYYYNKDGSKDKFAHLLASCIDAPTYLIAKNMYKNLDDFYSIYLNDITICISLKSNGMIHNVWGNNVKSIRIFDFAKYEKKGKDAASFIEQLLDNQELVMVSTVYQMLPFSDHYDPHFDINRFKPSHVFLIVSYDYDSYYYVDSETVINKKNFVSYDGNKDIGIIKKDILLSALNVYCEIYTIKLNNNNLQDIKTSVDKIIFQCYKNYHKCYEEIDGKIVLYGYEAINKLIDISNKKQCLVDETYLNGLNLYQLLNWKLWDMHNRRKILFECVRTKLINEDNKYDEQLISIISDCGDAWQLVRNVITKRYINNLYEINGFLSKYFIWIRSLEDKLNICLQRLLDL